MPGGATVWFGLVMVVLAAGSLVLLWRLDVIRPGSFVRLGAREGSAFAERRRVLMSGWPACAAGAWLAFAMVIVVGIAVHAAGRWIDGGGGGGGDGGDAAGSGLGSGVRLAVLYGLLCVVSVGIVIGVNVATSRLSGGGGKGGGCDALGVVPSGRGVWYGVVGFVLVMPVLLVVGMVSRLVDGWLRGGVGDAIAHDTLRELVSEGAGSASFWWTSLTVTVPVPMYEEILYRGLVQSAVLGAWVALSSRFVARREGEGHGGFGGDGGVGGGGGWMAIGVVSVLFALMHVGVADAVAMPTYIVLSVALGVVYERTGRLVAPVVLHGLFNASQIGIAMLTAGAQG